MYYMYINLLVHIMCRSYVDTYMYMDITCIYVTIIHVDVPSWWFSSIFDVLSLNEDTINGFLHWEQIRSNFPLGVAPDNWAISAFSGEQCEHTTRPHILQWCLRTKAVNFCLQIIHCFDAESGTHTALCNTLSLSPPIVKWEI